MHFDSNTDVNPKRISGLRSHIPANVTYSLEYTGLCFFTAPLPKSPAKLIDWRIDTEMDMLMFVICMFT